MRTSTAYFAGVGTVVAAVVAGLGGGMLISNIVSPHAPKIEMSKLELRMSEKPIPASNVLVGTGTVRCGNRSECSADASAERARHDGLGAAAARRSAQPARRRLRHHRRPPHP